MCDFTVRPLLVDLTKLVAAPEQQPAVTTVCRGLSACTTCMTTLVSNTDCTRVQWPMTWRLWHWPVLQQSGCLVIIWCKRPVDTARHDLQGSNAEGFQLDIQEITAAGAMAFVAIASASLLILYFFLNNAFYWMLVSSSLLWAQLTGDAFLEYQVYWSYTS